MLQSGSGQTARRRVIWLVAVIRACMHSTVAANNTLTVTPEIQYAINGSYANFTCTPKVNNVYWVINGHAANGAHTGVQQMLEEEGYIFYDSDSLTVSVPARELTNNTGIRCRGFSHGYSINNATLIVVLPTAPLAPEISIDVASSSSSVSVRWFQPFLWPEPDTNFNQVVYYNITVTEAGETYAEYIYFEKHVILNYSNATGSLPVSINDTNVECLQLSVWVSAVNDYGASNRTLVTKRIPKVPGAFPSNGVEISTYFDSNGSPIIFMSIKPPKFCSFVEYNYSVIVSEGRGARSEVLRIGPNEKRPTPDDSIHEKIDSGLERDAQYTARVVVDTDLGSTTSSEIMFNTHHYLTGQNPTTANSSCVKTNKALYLSVMGASIGLSTLILFSVTVVLIMCILCSRYGRRHRENSRKKNKPLSSMTDNPIYDGPIYESVVQDFNTLQSNTSEAVASASAKTNSDTKARESPSPDNSVRYLDKPIQPQKKMHSSLNGHPGGFDLSPRSASVSVPSKRKAQERNKLQLTLSLGGTSAVLPSNTLGERKNGIRSHSMSGRSVTIHHPTAPKIIPAIATLSSQDENYTVMSPAGTRTAMLGSLENGFGPELSPEDTEKYRE